MNNYFWILKFCTLAGVLLVSFAYAKEPANENTDGNTPTLSETRQILKSADVMGSSVKNTMDVHLGTIKDLMITVPTGKIRYAVLSDGGYLGFKKKLSAVPWSAFTFNNNERAVKTNSDQPDIRAEATKTEKRSERQNATVTHFVLNITKEQLAKSPGFNKSQWPNSPDQLFGITETNEAENTGKAYRCSDLKGMSVTNLSEEQLGSISDLTCDMQQGKIRYIVLSVRGANRMGDKLFAVPLTAFTPREDQKGTTTMHLSVSKSALDQAQGFDKNNWPDSADPDWVQKITDAAPKPAYGTSPVKPTDPPPK